MAAAFCGAAIISGAGVAQSLAATRSPRSGALPADDKKVEEQKPEFDPKDVRVGPPAELAALRAAVEAAAKKGENVDEIRKQLDALEKALAGKAWVKPKFVEDPPAPVFPVPPPFVRPVPFPNPVPFPIAPGGANFEALQKAQELMQKAADLAAEDAVKNRDKIAALQKEARDLMQQAIRPGGPFFQPVMPAIRGGGSRLGVRVEKVPAAVADQLELPAGRGVLVAEVVPGSAAEKAGLKASDVLVELAGKPVADDPTEFVRTVQGMKSGEKVDIGYYRKGKKAEAKAVPLADLVPAPAFDLDRFPAPPMLIPIFPDPNVFPPLPPFLPPLDGAKSRSVSVKVRNGNFTIDATEDGVKFLLEGAVGEGKPAPTKIEIADGAKKVEAPSVEKLPAEYRDRVQKILDSVKVGK